MKKYMISIKMIVFVGNMTYNIKRKKIKNLIYFKKIETQTRSKRQR